MQIEKLQYRQPGSELPCFRCHGMAAENRVTMAIGDHGGKLIVCLCEACSQLSEIELSAHFTNPGNNPGCAKNSDCGMWAARATKKARLSLFG